MSAQVIPLRRDAESLWAVFQRLFLEWEVNPTAENAERKDRAFAEFERVFRGSAA